jgi:hypothetical protein
MFCYVTRCELHVRVFNYLFNEASSHEDVWSVE